MSFFPYDPPVSDDDPEDDDLLSALHNDDALASLQSHRSDSDVVMPSADNVDQPLAAFLDALFSANVDAPTEQLQQQFLVWSRRQFQAATTRQQTEGALVQAQEQHVARLLSWLE